MAVNFVCVEHHAYSLELSRYLECHLYCEAAVKACCQSAWCVALFLDASNASFWGSTMMRVWVHPQVTSSTVSRQMVLAFVNGIK